MGGRDGQLPHNDRQSRYRHRHNRGCVGDRNVVGYLEDREERWIRLEPRYRRMADPIGPTNIRQRLSCPVRAKASSI